MCGRYELNATPQQIAARFGVLDVPLFAPNADLRPTETAPVIRIGRDGQRACELMRWGLIPSWSKDMKIGSRCFNARAETVATLPAFRNAFQRRRCIVPADAFFEWPAQAGVKRKVRIASADGGLLAFAGLWEYWRPEGQEGVVSYTILTTTPSAEMAPYHNRMPVVLAARDHARWLDPTRERPDELLRPAPEGTLRFGPAGPP